MKPTNPPNCPFADMSHKDYIKDLEQRYGDIFECIKPKPMKRNKFEVGDVVYDIAENQLRIIRNSIGATVFLSGGKFNTPIPNSIIIDNIIYFGTICSVDNNLNIVLISKGDFA